MRRIVFSILLFSILWAALAVFFAVERTTCVPVLSAQCGYAAWQSIGDLVLFKWVGHDWATFISGILALFAALLGATFLHNQIKQSDRHERQRRERHLAGARSVLPLVLSSCTDYVVESGKILVGLLNACKGEGFPRSFEPAPSFPAIPIEISQGFREAIEYSTDGQDGLVYAKIIEKLQIQRSRLQSLEDAIRNKDSRKIVVRINLETYIVDSAEIYARVSALFPYARHEEERVPINFGLDQMITALHLMGANDAEQPRLVEAVAKRHERLNGL